VRACVCSCVCKLKLDKLRVALSSFVGHLFAVIRDSEQLCIWGLVSFNIECMFVTKMWHDLCTN
jgi:hypothetical protein